MSQNKVILKYQFISYGISLEFFSHVCYRCYRHHKHFTYTRLIRAKYNKSVHVHVEMVQQQSL